MALFTDVSIVSHGHGAMVDRLVNQLVQFPEVVKIVLTQNVPERTEFVSHPKVFVIQNQEPKGFGENHNFAFRHGERPYFCVLNPDISLQTNPFPELFRSLKENSASVVGPLVLSPAGAIEDSIRRFPTLASLLRKSIGLDDGSYPVAVGGQAFSPDWIAGMFMLFSSQAYARLDGFDEDYYLYYEDVDICARSRQANLRVLACPSVSVTHDAQRASHRDLRHMRFHLASMVRYLWKYSGLRAARK